MTGSAKDSRPDHALGAVAAALPSNETLRLAALHETAVLDTAPEQTYDDLTALAAHICGTPIALISLVDSDRQWFKSRVGLGAAETPRELAFCAHALLDPEELFEIADATRDKRFAGNPLVTTQPDIRFYAGAPLLSEEGLALGTLCVIDRKPRVLDEHQRASLRTIGRLASELLRNRRHEVKNQHYRQAMVEQLEREMAESEQRYRQLADNNPAMMIRCRNGPGWPMLYASRAAEQITGYPASAFTEQPLLWGSLMLPEDAPAMAKKLAEQLAQGTDIQVEYRIRHRDGSIRWIEGNARLKKLNDGSEIYEGLNVDITQRKASEQALAESEARYKALADNSPVISIRCLNEPGWPMLYMSKAALAITGYEAAEFVDRGLLFGALVLAEDIEPLQQSIAEQLARGPVLQTNFRLRRQDGEIRWLEGNVRLLTLSNGSEGYEGTLTDITDRKESELLLAERADALERATVAIHAARIAPFSWYVERDFVETNALGETLHGLTADDTDRSMAGFMARVHPDDREALASNLRQMIEQQQPEFAFEYRTLSQQGRVRWVRNVGSLTTENGVLHTTGAVMDATIEVEVQRALEERTREMERANTELDEFTYIASHDLKEPLRGIHNYARFIAEDYADKLDAGGQHMLKAVSEQAERMQRLIEDLLEIARLGREPMKQSETDLDKLVDEVLASLSFSLAEKKVEVRKQPLGRIVCDRVRVGEVFRNLITNALKYNDKPVPVIEIGCRESALGETEFYVQDNGIGIKPDFHARVFAPFKRLHAKDAYGGGSGVGLAIVKRIVEAHGGHIGIRSEPGAGATFAFTLKGEHLS